MGDQRGSTMISNSFQKIKKVRSYVLEVAIQCGYAGMFVIVAVSLKHGLSHYVFAVYRHILATLVIAPFALVLERFNFVHHFVLVSCFNILLFGSI